jgi:DNA repair exonuclease SbcCD nuclease subunit
MARFAHLGDCHIGAWREEKLKEMNFRSFVKALDICKEQKVDFIIISGDLFDTTLPDLTLVGKAVDKIKELKDEGIEVYLIYGSHDFAPNSTSMLDILNKAGLLRKVVNAESDGQKIKLAFTSDRKTKAKITGISGRALGLDKKYFKMLDTRDLELEEGFKIFVFHNAVLELRSQYATYSEGIPLSSFPKKFDYYAGGHVHESIQYDFKDYGAFRFPGCLFGSSFTDLEISAKGEKRGFYIVDFNEKIEQISFVEVKLTDILLQQVNADKKTAAQIEETLTKLASELNVKGKIVLLKITGQLIGGRPSDIGFNQIKQTLVTRGAAVASINHYGLLAEEKANSGQVIGESRQEIENKILLDMVTSFKIDPSIKEPLKQRLERILTSDNGVKLSSNLLNSLKIEKQEGETKRDFEERVLKNTLHLLEVEELE